MVRPSPTRLAVALCGLAVLLGEISPASAAGTGTIRRMSPAGGDAPSRRLRKDPESASRDDEEGAVTAKEQLLAATGGSGGNKGTGAADAAADPSKPQEAYDPNDYFSVAGAIVGGLAFGGIVFGGIAAVFVAYWQEGRRLDREAAIKNLRARSDDMVMC